MGIHVDKYPRPRKRSAPTAIPVAERARVSIRSGTRERFDPPVSFPVAERVSVSISRLVPRSGTRERFDLPIPGVG